MRIPYVDTPVPTSSPEEAAIVARIEARRAPRPLQSLNLALLHAPAVADGWNAFLGAIRTRTSLAADVRELAICAVAVVNGANYEWDHHAPLAEEAGLSRDTLDSLKRGETSGLNEKQAIVVEYYGYRRCPHNRTFFPLNHAPSSTRPNAIYSESPGQRQMEMAAQ
ncbi:hypothetical protein PLICRDRAFT_681226 [Plicaturopsis crispa FD-325 SS-3]|nr:hypothetical protein PLICRDRAFT_681226 [Plicaturopsis crispa FD-325 SS-3]